jgi:hypothetical protein
MWFCFILTVIPGLKHHFQPVARVLRLPFVSDMLPDLEKDVEFIYPI